MAIVYPQQYANKYLNSFDRTKLAKHGGAFSQGQHVILGARLSRQDNTTVNTWILIKHLMRF